MGEKGEKMLNTFEMALNRELISELMCVLIKNKILSKKEVNKIIDSATNNAKTKLKVE